LVVLSFDILNPGWDEANAAAQAAIAAGKTPKSLKKPKVVDFGPEPEAGKNAQQTSAKKWSDWFAKNVKSDAPKSDSPAPPATTTLTPPPTKKP
jgi:hypothetical protein